MKTQILISCLLTVLLASCGSKKKVVRSNRKVKVVEAKPIKLPSVNQIEHVAKLEISNHYLNKHTLNYIRKYAPIAVQEMIDYKIPASITLAQGILESASGRSRLSRNSNNHFGIKCHKVWKGHRVYHDDDDIGECFRKYKYVETSYKDHSLFLTSRKRYAGLFKLRIDDYRSWARGLKKAGYATDRKYPRKLIRLIEDYRLFVFDENGLKKMKTRVVNTDKSKQYYVVKFGDTLYSISKKFNTSVELIKRINNLSDNTIGIGQKLRIQK